MVSLSQTQIALYLNEYQSLVSYMLTYPEESPYKLFKHYIYDSSNTEELECDKYYQRMLNIAYIFTKMKLFSIAEDYNLKRENNFINNNNLDISFIYPKITGNRGSISDKKILQMLRDGFNHTAEGNELYKISKSCRFIEFNFQNPSPITIKLSIDDISELTNSIADASQALQYFSFDQKEASTLPEYLDNLKIYRHYFPKKIEPETIASIVELQGQEKHEEASRLINTIEPSIKKEIVLSSEEKDNIIDTLNQLYQGGNISLEEIKEVLQPLIVILLNKELPIPIVKLDHYLLDSFFIGQLLPQEKFSYFDMLRIFLNGLQTDIPNPVNKHKDFFTKYRQLLLRTYYVNECEKQAYSTLLFTEYVISNFQPEEEFITIGETEVEYKKLRNSLVHGRWNFNKENIEFYDALPKTENETDYNWSTKLRLHELYQYCTNVVKEKLPVEKPKQLKKSILEVPKLTEE